MSFAHYCDLFVQEREGLGGIWEEMGYKAKNIVGFNDQLIPPPLLRGQYITQGSLLLSHHFNSKGVKLMSRGREKGVEKSTKRRKAKEVLEKVP